MTIGYEQIYHLRTGDFDCRARLQPASVLDVFQDIAGLNAEDTPGMTTADMRGAGLLWVVTRIKYEVLATPSLHQEVRVRTWPLAPSRVGFQREYTMHSLNGELMVRSTSEWVMMDARERSFVSAREVYSGPDDFSTETAFPGKTRRNRGIAPEQATDEHVVEPAYSDIDVNGHVNNTRYASWVLDALQLTEDEAIRSFQIDFRREVRIGDEVRVLTRRSEGGADAVGLDATGGEQMFAARIEFA